MAKDKKTTEDAPAETPYIAVFAGLRGAIVGQEYHMPSIYNSYLYLDAEGNPIPITPELIGTDPNKLPGFHHNEVYRFKIGDEVYLPVWDDELVQKALATGEFASVEAKNLILEAHNVANEACNKSGNADTYRAGIEQLKADLITKGWLLVPDGGLIEAQHEGQ